MAPGCKPNSAPFSTPVEALTKKHLRAPTLRELICEGLGYCCPYAFFKLYRRTAVIATRLGCSKRAVQEWKARFRACEISCENRENCLQSALRKRR